MIKKVIRCRNDMVMVFDENGEQLTCYQGYYADVNDSILKDSSVDTAFIHHFDTGLRLKEVPVEEW